MRIAGVGLCHTDLVFRDQFARYALPAVLGHEGAGTIEAIGEGDSDPQTFIPERIAHHAAGRFPFDRLIKTFPLGEINAAIAAQARGECIKAVLVP